MKPIVDGLEDQYGNDINFVRIDIDTDWGKDLAREHFFIGQPTWIFFDSTEEEVRRLQGAQTRDALESAIQQALD